MGFTGALAFLILGSSAVEFKANLRARLLPEIFTHLSYAEQDVEAGKLRAALAHSDVVLLQGVVRVHVAFDGVDARREADCMAAVKAGIAAWQDAVAPETEFKLVDDPTGAEVQVTFVPRLTMDGKPVGGHTHWRRAVKALGDGTYSASVTATVTLVVDSPSGRPMNDGQMRQAATHEFGHILGLDDSERAGDVMGSLNMRKPVVAPRPEEMEALTEIRDAARSIRARAVLLTEDHGNAGSSVKIVTSGEQFSLEGGPVVPNPRVTYNGVGASGK
jgi:hypothetical protein